VIGDIASLATAIAVLIAAAGLFAQNRARKFGLAQVYVERYWAVYDFFLRDGPPGPNSPNADRYLRLCEDEFDVVRQGWIDLAIWRIWHDGIRSQVDQLIRLGLDVTRYEHLQCCTDQPEHKPTKCNGLGKTRWWRRIWWFESPFADRVRR